MTTQTRRPKRPESLTALVRQMKPLTAGGDRRTAITSVALNGLERTVLAKAAQRAGVSRSAILREGLRLLAERFEKEGGK